MGVYTHSEGSWVSRRGGFIVALIAFHVVLFWLLKSGLAVKIMEVIAPPIKVEIVNEVKKELPPPPPPPPKMEIPPVEIPPPVVDIQIPVEVQQNTITNTSTKPTPPPPPAPPPPKPVVRTRLTLNKGYQPNVDDYYPEQSRRLEEEGVAKVKVCIGTNGRVLNAALDETSGSSRLDDAALKVSKLFRFNPPTEDGKPIDNACGVLPIRFQLPKN